jgi:hypothetical protein
MEEEKTSVVYDKLTAHLSHRKTRRRDIPIAIRKEIQKEITTATKTKAKISSAQTIYIRQKDNKEANEEAKKEADKEAEDNNKVDEEIITTMDTAPVEWHRIEKGTIIQVLDGKDDDNDNQYIQVDVKNA